ncbi:MAG: ribosome small subunit-dependent GTPase A [Candidatus Eisenbacteria bacterium]|nr:ribosome small subunit-dependent GTPase A [Candidatus Eisenbacteria bacterium]
MRRSHDRRAGKEGAASPDGGTFLPGCLIGVDPGRIEVLTERGTLSASLRGALKIGPRTTVHLVAVGDQITLECLPDGTYRLYEVGPRRNCISRVDPGDRSSRREQVLAANLDQLVVVVTLEQPPLNRRGLDRLLVLGEISDIPVRIVLNKADRTPSGTYLEEYRRIGYEVIVTSALSGTGIDTLRERLVGRVSLLCGASGVGKSSLANAIQPGLDLRVGEVSAATGKGTHTTTRVGWHALAAGGALLDSPGIRGIRPYGLTAENLSLCFREFGNRPACQFSDCRHRAEPGCAILAALDRGEVSPARHESYLRILAALEEPDGRTKDHRSRRGASWADEDDS